MTNCAFQEISIPEISSFLQFTDKGSYYSQLPYVFYETIAVFINVTFENITAFTVMYPVDPSLLTLPLVIYGEHSITYPLNYIFENVTFLNNIAGIIYFVFSFIGRGGGGIILKIFWSEVEEDNFFFMWDGELAWGNKFFYGVGMRNMGGGVSLILFFFYGEGGCIHFFYGCVC